MRVAWSTLIVLVLLAPFGRVGITATPLDADVVTAPRRAGAPVSPIAEAAPPERDEPVAGWPWRWLAPIAIAAAPIPAGPPAPSSARGVLPPPPRLRSSERCAAATPRGPPGAAVTACVCARA